MIRQAGVIGLDAEGIALALQLQRNDYEVIAFDARAEKKAALAEHGIMTVNALDTFAESISSKRMVWTMVPEPELLDELLERLQPYLAVGDIVIDGAGSFYRDTARRAEALNAFQIDFLDCCLSKKENSADPSYAFVGGNKFAFVFCERIIHAAIGTSHYLHCGKSGAGHFVQMTCNQMNPEDVSTWSKALETLAKSNYNIKLLPVVQLLNASSPLRDRLTRLVAALEQDPALESVPGETLKEKITTVLLLA